MRGVKLTRTATTVAGPFLRTVMREEAALPRIEL